MSRYEQSSEQKKKRREYSREWYIKNREKKKAQSLQWKLNNPEKRKAGNRRWLDNNLDKHSARNQAYRAKKINAQLKGFEHETAAIYKRAKDLEREDGVPRYVHHIVPLLEYNYKGIYGLHVPWNLEILTKEEHDKRHEELRKTFA